MRTLINWYHWYFQYFAFQHHPSIVAYGCVAFIMLVGVGFLMEARRRHNQLKMLKRSCKRCRQTQIARRHFIVRLSPDLSGGFLKRLSSQADFLCQTQAMCVNALCPHYLNPFVEKTELKHWRFKNQFFRFRELRETVPIQKLIVDDVVSHVLRERQQKSVSRWKKVIPPVEPPVLGSETSPEVRGPFPDIKARELIGPQGYVRLDWEKIRSKK